MSPKNLKLAIIIPVHNGISYTKDCLSNLSSEIEKIPRGHEIIEIVLVDDGSNDGTSGWVNENFPYVHVIHGDGNLWWSGGINKGSRYALETLMATHILWWNNDVQTGLNYLGNLWELINQTDRDTLLGSKVYVIDSDIIWGMGGVFYPSSGKRKNYAELEKDKDEYQVPVEVDWFPGMGTTIPAEVYEKIGFLDEERFPQYHGDSDFTYRAKKAGFRLIAHPKLIIYNDNKNTGLIHKGKISNLFKSLSSIKSNYNFRKDFAFYRKHAGSIKAYQFLFARYIRYIGGFFKWKILRLIGISK
jgi:GT2 family glycosyltransferase